MKGGEPFWVDPPEGWYHVALCRLADFFANHNYKKVKVKNHLFVPSNTNGQSLQVGPKTCFLTSHYVNRMLGSKNPSKIQNWDRYFSVVPPAQWWWFQCSVGRGKCHIKVSYKCGRNLEFLGKLVIFKHFAKGRQGSPRVAKGRQGPRGTPGMGEMSYNQIDHI